MTFDEFKADFLAFLEDSTVNLGRRGTKTRQAFIEAANTRFNAFVAADVVVEPDTEEIPSTNLMSGSVMCIKPKDSNRVLDVGKGVHAMTPSESMRADEQLNRSPYGAKHGKKGSDDE